MFDRVTSLSFELLTLHLVIDRLYSSSMAGNKISILAGDFLLSRASVLLASLRNTQVVEIMAGALESIMVGQMQLHRPSVVLNVDNYIRNIELRTGNLLASGCQCAALIAGATAVLLLPVRHHCSEYFNDCLPKRTTERMF